MTEPGKKLCLNCGYDYESSDPNEIFCCTSCELEYQDDDGEYEDEV